MAVPTDGDVGKALMHAGYTPDEAVSWLRVHDDRVRDSLLRDIQLWSQSMREEGEE